MTTGRWYIFFRKDASFRIQFAPLGHRVCCILAGIMAESIFSNFFRHRAEYNSGEATHGGYPDSSAEAHLWTSRRSRVDRRGLGILAGALCAATATGTTRIVQLLCYVI